MIEGSGLVSVTASSMYSSSPVTSQVVPNERVSAGDRVHVLEANPS